MSDSRSGEATPLTLKEAAIALERAAASIRSRCAEDGTILGRSGMSIDLDWASDCIVRIKDLALTTPSGSERPT